MSYLNENAGALQFTATIVLVTITIVYVILTRRLASQPERDRQQRALIAYEAVKTELTEILQCCYKAKSGPILLPTMSWENLKGELLGFASLALRSDTWVFYGKVRRCNATYERWANEQAAGGGGITKGVVPGESRYDFWVRDAKALVDECKRLCERYLAEDPAQLTKKRERRKAARARA